MILCDRSLRALHHKLVDPADDSLINPASIDIRIGRHAKVEYDKGPAIDQSGNEWTFRKEASFREIDLYEGPLWIQPNQFVLIETYECLMVPNGYSVELKLKSSIARKGWNHSLAFWFDPGWYGIGTMEIKNILQFAHLELKYGMRFGQIIVHRNDGESEKPYQGRYQNATTVEAAKPEKV